MGPQAAAGSFPSPVSLYESCQDSSIIPPPLEHFLSQFQCADILSSSELPQNLLVIYPLIIVLPPPALHSYVEPVYIFCGYLTYRF